MKPNRKILTILAGLALIFGLAACGTAQKTYHESIMRGSIADVQGDQVVLCVGSRDGASAGQTLDVYTMQRRAGPKASFMLRKTGSIQILEIVDEHFARAKIVSGKVAQNDVAELAR
jgi:hypothetical protein